MDRIVFTVTGMKFGLVSASYIIEDDIPKVVLFCRDENSKKVVFRFPYSGP